MNRDDGFRWAVLILLALLVAAIYSDIRDRQRADYGKQSIKEIIETFRGPRRPPTPNEGNACDHFPR